MTYHFACFKILYQLHHMTSASANISLNIKLIRFMLIYVAQVHLCFLLWRLPLDGYTQIWSLWGPLRVFHHCCWKPCHFPFICPCPRDVTWADIHTRHLSLVAWLLSLPCAFFFIFSSQTGLWSSKVFSPYYAPLFSIPASCLRHVPQPHFL